MKSTSPLSLTFSVFMGFTCIALPSFAQEQTAGGALQTEASWSALKSMITATNGNVSVLRIEMNEVKKCGAQRKIWTGTQCLDSATVDSIVNCGKLNKVFNGTGCVAVSGGNRWIHAGNFSRSSLGAQRNAIQQDLNGVGAGRACSSTEVAGRQCSTENSRCNTGINCDVDRDDGKANRYTCSATYISCN